MKKKQILSVYTRIYHSLWLKYDSDGPLSIDEVDGEIASTPGLMFPKKIQTISDLLTELEKRGEVKTDGKWVLVIKPKNPPKRKRKQKPPMRWMDRPNVKTCKFFEQGYDCECPACSGECREDRCTHAMNTVESCEEYYCPRWNGKRWKQDDGYWTDKLALV